jgi:hypothetical protein
MFNVLPFRTEPESVGTELFSKKEIIVTSRKNTEGIAPFFPVESFVGNTCHHTHSSSDCGYIIPQFRVYVKWAQIIPEYFIRDYLRPLMAERLHLCQLTRLMVRGEAIAPLPLSVGIGANIEWIDFAAIESSIAHVEWRH